MTYKRIYLPAIAVAFLWTGCKKQVLDINTDPNNPTVSVATPALVLPNALAVTGAIMNDPTAANANAGNAYFAFAGLWMGHMGYSGSFNIATEDVSYNLTNNFSGAPSLFDLIYRNNDDYNFVETKGKELGNRFYEGIGKLMKAYNFQTLVDVYGNVPYFNALQGNAGFYPKYDDAKSIYEDLGKKIDSCIAIFKGTANTNLAGDILFGGNADSWFRFANTLKLRLLLRQSERSDRSSYVQSELAKFNSSTEFLISDAALNPGYLNSAGKFNPFWASNHNNNGDYTQDYYRAGGFFIDFLKANNDPRISVDFMPAVASGQYSGPYFGETGASNAQTSTIGPGLLKSYSQPSIIMTAAESFFEQAEAALRGWITGDPKALYQQGVTASFIYLGLKASDAQSYYTQAGNKQVNWNATSGFQEQLALIIRQKWAALALINELEPFNDYRRLHLPADVPLSRSPYSTGKIPNRLLYPQREYDVNPANVKAAGTDSPDAKIWWQP